MSLNPLDSSSSINTTPLYKHPESSGFTPNEAIQNLSQYDAVSASQRIALGALVPLGAALSILWIPAAFSLGVIALTAKIAETMAKTDATDSSNKKYQARAHEIKESTAFYALLPVLATVTSLYTAVTGKKVMNEDRQ